MIDANRTVGDALDAWLHAIADQRSHDEYESRMKLYVRPTFDRTPLVKVIKAKLIELRTALKSSDDPISNATINTLFASLSSAYSYFIEQGWCSENPLRLIEDLEVAERPFTWLSPRERSRSSSAPATTTSGPSSPSSSAPACGSMKRSTSRGSTSISRTA